VKNKAVIRTRLEKECRNQIDDEENGKSIPIGVGLETI